MQSASINTGESVLNGMMVMPLAWLSSIIIEVKK